jgi:hypothetical protein
LAHGRRDPVTTINKALNLVVPIVREDDTVAYVHHTPITYETFQRYYLVLTKTWASLIQQGLNAVAGPRMAALLMESVAKATARAQGVSWWEGEDGVERGLISEMVRLSNILKPTPAGWQVEPLDGAFGGPDSYLSDEEAGDVRNQIAFFTVAWVAGPRTERARTCRAGALLYDSLTTSLDPTAFSKSLTTSSAAESTGEKPPPPAA